MHMCVCACVFDLGEFGMREKSVCVCVCVSVCLTSESSAREKKGVCVRECVCVCVRPVNLEHFTRVGFSCT